MKTILKILLSITWELPQTILGIILLLFSTGKKKIYKTATIYTWKLMGGISLGRFIFLTHNMYNKERIIKHEYGHSLQSYILGPLYLIVVGIPSIIRATFWKGNSEDYYKSYPENWADKLGKVKQRSRKM